MLQYRRIVHVFVFSFVSFFIDLYCGILYSMYCAIICCLFVVYIYIRGKEVYTRFKLYMYLLVYILRPYGRLRPYGHSTPNRP